MNKAHFQALLDMGYSPLEAIDLLTDQQEEAEPATEPITEPEAEPEAEPETQPEPSGDLDALREEMKTLQSDINKSLNEITKLIQRNNIRTMGSDEDPGVNRAEEFLAELIKGGNK